MIMLYGFGMGIGARMVTNTPGEAFGLGMLIGSSICLLVELLNRGRKNHD